MERLIDKQVLITDKYLSQFEPDDIITIEGSEYNQENVFIATSGNEKAIVFISNGFTELPNYVVNFIKDNPQLKAIIFRDNPLHQVPKCILACTNLEALELSITKITEFPTDFANLKNLKCLLVCNGILKEFPKSITNCKNIVDLDLSSNQLTEIPDEIGNLKNLKTLRLHYNKIDTISESLGKLEKLEKLILCNNEIQNLPISLCKLSNLQELDVAFNNIKIFPLNLSETTTLTEIYADNNPVINLPQDFNQRGFIFSSKSIKNFLNDKKIINENSIGQFDQALSRRVLRGARAMLIRGFYYIVTKEWDKSYFELNDAYTLALKLGDKKVAIMSATFLGYVQVFFDNQFKGLDVTQATLNAFEWSKKNQNLVEAENDLRFKNLFNQLFIRATLFNIPKLYEEISENDIKNLDKPIYEVDFFLFLNCVIENNYSIIAIDNEDIGMMQIFESTDFKGLAELNFRDYVRGLLWLNNWEKSLLEFSNVHQIKLSNKGRKAVICPTPNSENEVGIRMFQLTNTDKIGILIHFFKEEPIWVYIDCASIRLNQIVLNNILGNLSPNQKEDELMNSVLSFMEMMKKLVLESDNDIYEATKHSNNFQDIGKSDSYSSLWEATLGAKIIHSINSQKEVYCNWTGKSIHQLLQEQAITSVKLMPIGSLHSLSIGSAYNKEEQKYAIDYYKITYFPIWKSKVDEKLKEFDYFIITDDIPRDLPFAQFEKDTIIKLLTQQGKKGNELQTINIDEKIKTSIINLCNKSKLIHFACHGNNNVKIRVGKTEIVLSPEEIAKLDLGGSNIVLNCCNTSQSNYVTMAEDYTPAISFLLAGASNVLATNLEINDYASFRFSKRFYELLELNYSFENVYRQVCEECENCTIPNYVDYIKEFGSRQLYATALLKKDEKVNWQLYILWQSNHN
jgi:hypothetical protein